MSEPFTLGPDTVTVNTGDRTVTIERTARSYADDLCDAYNAAKRREDIEWYVAASGDVRLRDVPAWSVHRIKHTDRKREDQRQEWMRRNQEGAFSDPRQAEFS